MNDNRDDKLFTFDFVGLCLLTFLAYCNTTVFYSLYSHLQAIGVPQEWRGFLIGGSSLATIVFFAAASPFMTVRAAPKAIYAGIVLLVACGMSYLFVRSVPGLLAIRLMNGVGVYLMSASAMTLLVTRIPPSRSGQAFGVYSVAMLLPYSIIPTVFDAISAWLPSFAHGYAIMALALIPAAIVNGVIARRQAARPEAARAESPTVREILDNLKGPGIGLLLLVNTVYYLSFSSLFFLSKNLFHARGVENVGYFFSIQTACMILMRVMGARLFDTISKVWLVRICYGLTAAAFLLLYLFESATVLYPAALVLGLGMGMGAPSLNSLMFTLSGVRFKGVNSNLMMMSLQLGSFCGPFLGNASVGRMGYGGFLLVGVAANLGGIALSLLFPRDALKAPGA